MSLPIYVDAYSGYRANERPRQFCVDEDLIPIAEVEDRWNEPDAEYFRVRSSDGKRYILRCSTNRYGGLIRAKRCASGVGVESEGRRYSVLAFRLGIPSRSAASIASIGIKTRAPMWTARIRFLAM